MSSMAESGTIADIQVSVRQITQQLGNAIKKIYLGKGSHLDPANIYTMVTPLSVGLFNAM